MLPFLTYRCCVIAHDFTGAVGIVDGCGDGEAVGSSFDAATGCTVQGVAVLVDSVLPGLDRGVAASIAPLEGDLYYDFIGAVLAVDSGITGCGRAREEKLDIAVIGFTPHRGDLQGRDTEGKYEEQCQGKGCDFLLHGNPFLSFVGGQTILGGCPHYINEWANQ